MKQKQPWPTKDVMTQVYEMNLWGENQTPFYSGEGSHNASIVKPFIKAVGDFLRSFENPISVCDLGCGDFNIGKKLVHYTNSYIGVDIVTDLINHNRDRFKQNNLEFHCLDIADDGLPEADCVIIRQVLQHLSNKEVQNVLNKLSIYKYIILTEHIPNGEFVPNLDIISGQGIRLKKNSGLDIFAPPFSYRAKERTQISKVELKNNQGIIVTSLLVNFQIKIDL